MRLLIDFVFEATFYVQDVVIQEDFGCFHTHLRAAEREKAQSCAHALGRTELGPSW